MSQTQTDSSSKPAYMVFNVQVTNAQQYDAYRVFSGQAMQEFNAEVLVRGGEMTVLEGQMFPRTVILKFTSVAQAQAFYDSQTYSKGRELRKDAAIANIAIIEGI